MNRSRHTKKFKSTSTPNENNKKLDELLAGRAGAPRQKATSDSRIFAGWAGAACENPIYLS